ncbi:MAG TPA: TauD/TfdA family dioxygenase [Burkholderiales bacterium]|nr:TauD/TfdA family dioxygenase [Burkholderiales bacterium]
MSELFRFEKLGDTLGAEICDIDVSRALDDATFEEILAAFHEHAVIVFRDQKLTPEQQIAFSRRFGELDVNVRSRFNKPGHPEIFVVSNIIENGQPIGVTDAGRYWHTDHCYLKEPSRCSLLYALEVPRQDDGRALGDTLFANVAAAHDALTPQMKQRLAGCKAVNSYSYTYERKVQEFDRTPLKAENREAPPDIEHPVVRTHPFTGRKCLFVNEGYTTRIVGMSAEQSEETLQFLFSHLAKPEFQYRHQWQVGDLLLWDNCLTQHKAVFDYALPLRRRMERTTLRGCVPF